MRTTLKAIEKEITGFYEITAGQMFKRTRKREFVEKRQIFYYLAKLYTVKSLGKIGKYAGSLQGKPFDHATVLHGSKTIGNLIASDKKLKHEIQEIIANIRKNKDTLYTENEMLFKKELDEIIEKNKDLERRILKLERINDKI